MQTKLDRIKRMFILMLGFIIVDNISAAEQVSDTIKTEAVVSKISSIEDIEQRLSILNENRKRIFFYGCRMWFSIL